MGKRWGYVYYQTTAAEAADSSFIESPKLISFQIYKYQRLVGREGEQRLLDATACEGTSFRGFGSEFFPHFSVFLLLFFEFHVGL